MSVNSRYVVLLTAEVSNQLLTDVSRLVASDFKLVYRPTEPGWAGARLRDLLASADAVIAGGDVFDDASLDAAPNLRIIARLGAGFDRVDVDAASRRGVFVTTTPGANAAAVADFTMGLIISLLRHLPSRAAALREGRWASATGVELAGERLGLLGFGAIGREVARRALAFDMRVAAYDPMVASDMIASSGVEPLPVDDVLASANVVSLHMPLRGDTQGFMNSARLASMSRGSFIVNTARGGLLDEAALLAELDADHIAGAALDVFATEPPSGITMSLVRHPRVIATPHIAGTTAQSERRMLAMAIESVAAALNGEIPKLAINAAVVGAVSGGSVITTCGEHDA
jgi:D-3-phosphoglycerate dehydrogenase / 2-oxoglutarate reductase